ncbi:putative baseplate assembly protein [Streptomyces sp. ISL-11]|uniref:putative baseplate assembly protein n=1 Tax=Streptomyces sp. ISL-11 TaxID=2819174 RepID=UPI001BE5FD62|nr:putative baseplate assembly protein [Streptomyces sp. ISL-11]MBT2382260.1 putative baseplate assembly protein [Streptomyces sp. ISL-11]
MTGPVPGTGPRALTCEIDRRRAAVRDHGLAGIEAVSVGPDRRTLTVTFFGTLPAALDRHSFRVEGGRRVTGIQVTAVTHAGPDEDEQPCARLSLDRCGDESVYRLYGLGSGFDTRFASREFTFRSHPGGLDCLPETDDRTEPQPAPAPAIDYLAKDYASFRRLLLDRFSLTMPEWTERHVPDLGITLVELLAHVGDRLSYQQDAVATEAYLDTARLRTSVRRHARLVDYPMHDGCAARTFVCVETEKQITLPGEDLAFSLLPPDRFPGDTGPVVAARELHAAGHPVFQPVLRRDVVLHPAHNRISLWTWQDRECCLPAGTTEATLRDCTGEGQPHRVLRLTPGDVIVFEEVLGAHTGSAADADPSHRQAVRLTRVTPGVDALSDTPVLDIAWATEDALTFPFCVTTGEDQEVGVARGNTVLVEHGLRNTWDGRGAEVLTPAAGKEDRPAAPPSAVAGLRGAPVTRSAPYPRPAHIATAQARQLARLPDEARNRLHELRSSGAPLQDADRAFLRTLFGARVLDRVQLDRDPGQALTTLLTRFDEFLAARIRRVAILARQARSGYVLQQADTGWELNQTWGDDAWPGLAPDNPALHGPARDALRPDPREALPDVRVWAAGTDRDRDSWAPRRDLLSSGPRDRHLVGESDDDGVLGLRFGSGAAGARPPRGSELMAEYRIGNGRAGNVGREAIRLISSGSTGLGAVTRVRNPLPAVGGTDPEPVAEVRLAAPREAFRRLLRAVTAEDYAALAGRHPGVQRVAAALRWTGGWYEADIALDALGSSDVPRQLLEEVRQDLHRVRRIGHDVVTGPAVHVPLDVALAVAVEPGHVAEHVRRDVLRVLRPGPAPCGGLGLFDPDVLTFGTPVRVSHLIAAAAAVPGVRHVEVTRLRRLHGAGAPGAAAAEEVPASGVLRLRPLEIARLDDDPSRPDNGRLNLTLRGGR